MSEPVRPSYVFEAGRYKMKLGLETKIMGVLNVTPDSFSDGGLFMDPALAEERALKIQDEGAHILDIGGETSKPGSKPVSAREEIRRVLPVVKRLSKKLKIPLSLDTWKHEVAEHALDNGVTIINDITAFSGDRKLAKLVAKYRAGVVLMHRQGKSATMQKKPSYKNLLQEVFNFLYNATRVAMDAGIGRSRIAVDPGFGFGKTVQHNIDLLNSLSAFKPLGFPMLAGLSRKSFIGQVTGAEIHNRLAGSLACAAIAVFQGAHILRVHDILAHKQLTYFLDKSLSHTEQSHE